MEPVSSVLFSLFRGTSQHGEWVVACLQGAWPALLGDKLAAACRPRTFSNSRLVIEVVDPMWAGTLHSLERDILAKIGSATAGEVRSLAFTEPPSG